MAGRCHVTITLTQDDLADLAGTSRATVNRVLREDEQRGVLRLGRGRTTILDRAAQLPEPTLRSLDAIHLATALDLGSSVDILLTYDRVLIEAARAASLTTASPGASY